MLLAIVAPASGMNPTGRVQEVRFLIPSRQFPGLALWPVPTELQPGIRRPRRDGVVEGVAGQIRHPLTHVWGDRPTCGLELV